MEKSYVSENDEAVIACGGCGKTKNISVGNFKGKKHKLKVNCTCGNSFELLLEFRKYFRKDTSLHGNFNPDTANEQNIGKAAVVDLSLTGVCFKVRAHHGIEPGDTGELVFTLDNRKRTVLYRKVIVKNVNGLRIGCEFLPDNAPSKELGFFMLP